MVIFLLFVVLPEQMKTVETLVIDSTASTEAGNGSGGRVADGQRSGRTGGTHLRMEANRPDDQELHAERADSPRTKEKRSVEE